MISNREEALEWTLLSPELVYERMRYFLEYEEDHEYRRLKEELNKEKLIENKDSNTFSQIKK